MSGNISKIIVVSFVILVSVSCSLFGIIEDNEPITQTQSGGDATEELPKANPTEVPTPTSSDNQGRILYLDSDGINIFDIETGQSEQILSGDFKDAEVSPDGKMLAYLEAYADPEMWAVGNLKVMNLDTGQFFDTSLIPEDIETFTWSENSREITYTRRNYNYCIDGVDWNITGLYRYNFDTQENLSLEVGTDQYVFWIIDWSPDGRYLLFASGPDCSEGRGLMVYDSQSGEIDGIPYAEGSWSPDGPLLAVNEMTYYEPDEFPLMKYNVSTIQEEELFFKSGFFVSSPVWSPDGTWIAFAISPTDQYHPATRLINTITGEGMEIPLQNAEPILWSTECDMLSLSVTRDDFSEDIYLYHFDSGEVEQILSEISGRVLQWLD